MQSRQKSSTNSLEVVPRVVAMKATELAIRNFAKKRTSKMEISGESRPPIDSFTRHCCFKENPPNTSLVSKKDFRQRSILHPKTLVL